MKKIFLLGSERSGSNLLRTLLGNHSEISAPIAPHLCDVFFNNYKHYLPLSSQNSKTLFNDILAYINHPFNNWQLPLDIEYLNDKYKINSFINILDLIYTEKAIQESKNAYFIKDNNNHKYALGVKTEIPDSHFIYLYRDVRDQVASWLRTPLNTFTAFKSVNRWVSDQNECLSLNRFYNLPMHFVSYENLVTNPESTMSEILKYLDLTVEEVCFSTNKDNKEADKHILWKNINKPIKKNFGKYHDTLTNNELEMIETIAAKTMVDLGYSPETNCNWEMGNKYIFHIREKLNETKGKAQQRVILENEAKLLKDKNEFIQKMFKKFE